MPRLSINALEKLICDNVLQILDIGAPTPRKFDDPNWFRLAGAQENDRRGGVVAGWSVLWKHGFVNMFYRSWTDPIQNLSFEGVVCTV